MKFKKSRSKTISDLKALGHNVLRNEEGGLSDLYGNYIEVVFDLDGNQIDYFIVPNNDENSKAKWYFRDNGLFSNDLYLVSDYRNPELTKNSIR